MTKREPCATLHIRHQNEKKNGGKNMAMMTSAYANKVLKKLNDDKEFN